ncbi:MAG TPA: ester cyclase [Gaiellaceae bacterium]|nr:ester cyclase [Gaiellaceae bacterium]
MSAEDHKALIRRFYVEAWDGANYDVADAVFADEYVRHDARGTEALPGPEGQKQIAAAFRQAFPDLRFMVDLLIAEDDLVVGYWTATGTHLGPWATVEPTGRAARFNGVNIFRFADGKVVELWNVRDDLGLLEQIGARVHAGAPAT